MTSSQASPAEIDSIASWGLETPQALDPKPIIPYYPKMVLKLKKPPNHSESKIYQGLISVDRFWIDEILLSTNCELILLMAEETMETVENRSPKLRPQQGLNLSRSAESG